MNNTKKWVRGALCAGVAAGLILLLIQLFADQPGDAGSRNAEAALALAGSAGSGSAPHAAGASLAQGPAAPVSPWFDPTLGASTPSAGSPLSTMTPPRFAADSRGKLVLNSDTHANLEKLLLQDNPAAMRATLEQISKGLPPQAAAELKVLADQFQQYTKALSHSISPENAPENEQEGVKLIDSLHTLRVSYLGAETTQAMFGEEEATTRQIVALMAAEKDPNMTQQEKAEHAQEIISKRRAPAIPPAS
jgi:hypothetical protein